MKKPHIPYAKSPNILDKRARFAMDQVLAGKDLSRKFKSVDELFDDLNADNQVSEKF